MSCTLPLNLTLKKAPIAKAQAASQPIPRDGHETLFEKRKSGMGYGYRATCEFWVHATAMYELRSVNVNNCLTNVGLCHQQICDDSDFSMLEPLS